MERSGIVSRAKWLVVVGWVPTAGVNCPAAGEGGKVLSFQCESRAGNAPHLTPGGDPSIWGIKSFPSAPNAKRNGVLPDHPAFISRLSAVGFFFLNF